MAQMFGPGEGGVPSRKRYRPSGPNRGGRPGSARGRAASRRSAPPAVYNPPPLRATPTGTYSRPVPVPATKPGPMPPVKPPPPSISKFLSSDVGYQDQLRQFANSMQQFLADITRRKGVLNTEYGTSKKALGDQRVKDLELLEEDFGSRGLLRSGLYSGEVGDYEKEYSERVADLERQQKQAMSGLQAEQTRYKSQQQLKKQQAREAAIRRRAEKYGL